MRSRVRQCSPFSPQRRAKRRPRPRRLCESAIAIYREVADRQGEAEAVSALAVIEFRLGNFEASRRSYEQATQLAESIDYEQGIVDASTGLAYVEQRLGRLESAETTLLRAREGYSRLNDAARPDELRQQPERRCLAAQRSQGGAATRRSGAPECAAAGPPLCRGFRAQQHRRSRARARPIRSRHRAHRGGLRLAATLRSIDTLDMRIELTKTYLAAARFRAGGSASRRTDGHDTRRSLRAVIPLCPSAHHRGRLRQSAGKGSAGRELSEAVPS